MSSYKPQVSASLSALVQDCSNFYDFVGGTLPEKMQLETKQQRIVSALGSIVLEHYAAIVTLVREGLDGSAFALGRPLIESAYRAHWVKTCAPNDKIERIFAGDNAFPGLSFIAEELEQSAKNKGLFGAMKQHFATMHDYTHGGFEQMSSRFDPEGNVRAFYDDAAKSGLLKIMSGVVALLSTMWCQFVAADLLDGKHRAAVIMMYMNKMDDEWTSRKETKK